jgi:hypothetical protein
MQAVLRAMDQFPRAKHFGSRGYTDLAFADQAF